MRARTFVIASLLAWGCGSKPAPPLSAAVESGGTVAQSSAAGSTPAAAAAGMRAPSAGQSSPAVVAMAGTSAGKAGAAAPSGGAGAAAAAQAGAGGTVASAAGAPASAGTGAAGMLAGTAGMPAADGGSAAPNVPATGTFPAVSDPWQTGPYTVATMGGAGPSRNATVLYPREIGKDGKSPIVVWDNGAGQTGLSIYGALLNHLASHGFAVYAAYSATDQGKELLDGIDWMTAQAAESSSPFHDKLDVTKVAAMGHSQGSIATFAVAGDKRLTTTIHLSGGTNPDIADGHATLPNLHEPAAFICGEVTPPGGDGLITGDTASEWCGYDFDHAMVPVFLAQITGASHITAPGMTLGACAAWLRWRLMLDSTMKSMFDGPDCKLCKRPNWKCKSRGLDML